MTENETIHLVASAYVQTCLQAGTSPEDMIAFAERTRGKDSSWAGVVRTLAHGLAVHDD